MSLWRILGFPRGVQLVALLGLNDSIGRTVLNFGLYLRNYWADVDETWQSDWKLGPIDCIKFSWKSLDWWRHYDVRTISPELLDGFWWNLAVWLEVRSHWLYQVFMKIGWLMTSLWRILGLHFHHSVKTTVQMYRYGTAVVTYLPS